MTTLFSSILHRTKKDFMPDKLALGVYEHYKGKRYEVLGIAHHTETMEELVVYRALYGEYGLWVRPVAMFTGMIEIDGEQRKRFSLVTD